MNFLSHISQILLVSVVFQAYGTGVGAVTPGGQCFMCSDYKSKYDCSENSACAWGPSSCGLSTNQTSVATYNTSLYNMFNPCAATTS
jgi:hypothetical protein